MSVVVNRDDGVCRKCGGTLEVIDGDDATMTVVCADCSESYLLEPDALNDGAMDYYPRIMLEKMEAGDDEED